MDERTDPADNDIEEVGAALSKQFSEDCPLLDVFFFGLALPSLHFLLYRISLAFRVTVLLNQPILLLQFLLRNKALLLCGQLRLDQSGIHPIPLDQLPMSPLLNQFPPLQDKDPVGVLNRRQSVRNDNSRDISLGEPSQGLLDLFLILPVQGRSGLVQDEKLRVFAECSSNGYSLFLATGQLSPA